MTYRRFKANTRLDVPLPAIPAISATKPTELGSEVAEIAKIASSGKPKTVFAAAWDDDLDWQIAYEERAAILEFDEGLSRGAASSLARRQIDEQRRRQCH